MRAHLWRHAARPRHGKPFHSIFLSVIDAAIIATAVIATGAPPVRADGIRTETASVDTEHLFGFVEGADIGSKGEREFVVDSTLRAGRSAGSFAGTASELEFKYTTFQNFRISAAAAAAYYDIAGVVGIEDARRAAIQSMSVDARFRLLDRAQAPFGLTLSVSPHWGFVDETSGVRTGHYGAEIRLLADRELKADRLAGAINLVFANDRARLLASDGVQHESLVAGGVAVAAQIAPGLWLGGETRYLRDYSGAALNVFAGQALYTGPTVYARVGSDAFVSAAWDIQIWGGAVGAPGALDLANFERHQVKLRFGLEF
ncbi:MAG TPA: hypothetical protein VKT99_25335 [Xanthobacteraceae bacterium]|jgi:hypothetical protein|nr:hypothetical protein [Xanthobacteraceae bacterium]